MSNRLCDSIEEWFPRTRRTTPAITTANDAHRVSAPFPPLREHRSNGIELAPVLCCVRVTFFSRFVAV